MQEEPRKNSLYAPALFRVAESTGESADTRTLAIEPVEGPLPSWRPGQFGMFGVFGEGECPLTIASSPTRGKLECTFRKAGRVTRALFDCEEGDTIGFRGPYGKGFPLDEWMNRNVVFVAGGIGLPALRSSIEYVLDKRPDYGRVTILYGAKSTGEIIYRGKLEQWAQAENCRVALTVDPGGQDATWRGEVGLVPNVLERIAPSAAGAVAAVCGPPVMIKFSLASLEKLGFPPASVYTTLENRMKCGVGKCGRCNVGKVYACKDGPVFTAAELSQLPNDF